MSEYSWLARQIDRVVTIYTPADLFGGPIVRTVRYYNYTYTVPEEREVAVLTVEYRDYIPGEWLPAEGRYAPSRYTDPVTRYSINWADGSESLNPGGNYLREMPTAADIRRVLRDRGVGPAPVIESAPVHPAAESAAVLHAALRPTTTAADLFRDWHTAGLIAQAAEAGKTYSADLLEYAPRSVVVEAVAEARAAVEKRRADEAAAAKAAEKARLKAEAAAKRKIDRDPHVCKYPHQDDATLVGLVRDLATRPEDSTLVAAICDRYQELRVPPRNAAVFARRHARWAAVKAELKATTARGGKIRSRVRQIAGCGGANSVEIRLRGNENAGQAPVLTGEAPSHTFKGGGSCRSPGAAIRAGYKVEYHADTREVTVGVAWLADLIAREFAPAGKAAGKGK